MKRRLTLLPIVLLAASASAGPGPELASQARHELYAGRFGKAVTLYSQLVQAEPASGDAWSGLVRAQLEAHQSKEASASAEEALKKAPQTPGAETAAGMAAWRRGQISDAETHFRAALKININSPDALDGLATIYGSLSKFRTARDLRLKAWSLAQDDPELMLVHANTLKGAKHIAALEEILPLLDPDSRMARSLRVHIANDRAMGDMKVRRLTSPYQNSTVKLTELLSGPARLRGMGIKVQLNDRQMVTLLLDTGASGVSISPKMAERAGLQAISGESGEMKGIGDGKTQSAVAYLASGMRAGDVTFANYPIAVFRSAQTSDFDGLIGADVFQRFIVRIDFVHSQMSLETRAKESTDESDEPQDRGDVIAPGFVHALRFGNHLAIPTSINGSENVQFLIDSGAQSTLVDTETAKKHTYTFESSRLSVSGVQGKVNKVAVADRVTLAFAGLRQENPNLISINLDNMSDSMGSQMAGVLGMPVLRQLALTIDYRDGTVKLEYRKP